IAAVDHERRIVQHLDIGIDAVAFDAPGAVHLVEAKRGNRRGPAVDELWIAADADETAPGAHADQLADLHLLEVTRERIAARAGHPVDEHALGALMAVGRPLDVAGIALGPVIRRRSVEQFNESRRDLTAAVPALIDDECRLFDLTVELAEQLVLA